MKLYAHQEKFIDRNPDKALLCWEGGTGKTIGACAWLARGRDSDALVICPKKIKEKWWRSLEDFKVKKVTVVSKEEFKKVPVRQWSAIVVDEADEFASPLFVAKKRSQLSSALYSLVKSYPETPILLATATPIRSHPWNLHSLLTFAGHYIDWRVWRDNFFNLESKPYLPRLAYLPIPDWRIKARKMLERYADIVLLRDCVGELPPETNHVVNVKTPKYIKDLDAKPFFDEHRHEQQNKKEAILEIAKEYRKVLIVAYYVEQVELLQKELSKDRQTFAVYGGVKDQEEIIKQAQESDECFLIVQASLGAGFDADSFSCVVFASMSYAVRDYVQMKWRVRRIHNLHPVAYYHLFGGRCDKAVYNNVEKGKVFVPSEWIKENETTT